MDADDTARHEFIDPADVLSAETVDELGARLAGSDPLDIVDEVMDTGEDWWIGLDPAVDAALIAVVDDLLDDPVHVPAMVGLARAGYRLGRLLMGDVPHPIPGPPLADHLATLELMEGSLLLDHLPKEATPLSLWLSEELIRRNGWWQGRTDDIDDENLPDDLDELRGAGIVAADLGMCAALLEHDLSAGRVGRRASDRPASPSL